MKDAMITWLETYNKTTNEPVTKLYFNNNGKQDFVEDYTYFATEDFMSRELLESLSKGKTLTMKLQTELDFFRIESVLN